MTKCIVNALEKSQAHHSFLQRSDRDSCRFWFCSSKDSGVMLSHSRFWLKIQVWNPPVVQTSFQRFQIQKNLELFSRDQLVKKTCALFVRMNFSPNACQSPIASEPLEIVFKDSSGISVGVVWAQSTQDAGRNAHANWNVFPLMLLACSVDTPIYINRSHLLASRVLCGLGLGLLSNLILLRTVSVDLGCLFHLVTTEMTSRNVQRKDNSPFLLHKHSFLVTFYVIISGSDVAITFTSSAWWFGQNTTESLPRTT